MTIADRHMDEAIAWHVRLQADDADWAAFIDWLEADEAHRQAYDLVAVQDRQIDQQIDEIAVLLPANDDDGTFRTQRRNAWMTGVAAALAVVGLTSIIWPSAKDPDPVAYETGGTQRTIALADGAAIHMAPNSHLIVTADDVAKVNVVSGSAYFVAPSDPDMSFDIRAGAYQVRDIGTRFTVTRNDHLVSVAIADGLVSLKPEGAAEVRLRAGQGLQMIEGQNSGQIYNVEPGHIASWRTGRLVYDGTPFGTVVADIERTTGMAIGLDPSLAGKGFSGVLEIGNGSRLVTDFVQITGLRLEKRARAIYIRPAS